MGTTEILLCIFVGHLITVQSVTKEQDAKFSQDFPGFFETRMPFPLEANFDFTPYDTIFSSWQTLTPDFHMLAEVPPTLNIPGVQVSCDESMLTLLVDKISRNVVLTREEIQLGDSCYSNRELPNHFVFTYSFDQCGTTHVMQNGLKMFTNTLHLNLKKPLPTWWQTHSIVPIYCIPRRLYDKPDSFASLALPENDKRFNMKVMNPSWTSTAESNVYKKGQVVNLQVSVKPRPSQQLFIQSCFLSASPDPQTRHRHAVIMNKGCTALGPHAIAQFVPSDRADVVNFVLNTTYLISEVYIHCSVLTSDQGVTFGSKSCNYDVIHSRWQELSGDVEVCECCSSKCKGLSVKHLSKDAKAIVSTGALVFVDKDVETSNEVFKPEETTRPVTNSMQPDSSSDVTKNTIVSDTSVSRSKGVVVVSQDPVARLTLWLPGHVQDIEHGHNIATKSEDNLTLQLKSGELPELQPSTIDQESLLNPPANEIKGQGLNDLKHDSVWDLNVHTLDEMAQMQADAPVVHPKGTNAVQPIIRSKIQFSKGVDGSQTLSYEEEVVKQKEGDGVIRRYETDWIKRKQSGQKRLYSTFLDLLRRMDKAE